MSDSVRKQILFEIDKNKNVLPETIFLSFKYYSEFVKDTAEHGNSITVRGVPVCLHEGGEDIRLEYVKHKENKHLFSLSKILEFTARLWK